MLKWVVTGKDRQKRPAGLHTRSKSLDFENDPVLKEFDNNYEAGSEGSEETEKSRPPAVNLSTHPLLASGRNVDGEGTGHGYDGGMSLPRTKHYRKHQQRPVSAKPRLGQLTVKPRPDSPTAECADTLTDLKKEGQGEKVGEVNDFCAQKDFYQESCHGSDGFKGFGNDFSESSYYKSEVTGDKAEPSLSPKAAGEKTGNWRISMAIRDERGGKSAEQSIDIRSGWSVGLSEAVKYGGISQANTTMAGSDANSTPPHPDSSPTPPPDASTPPPADSPTGSPPSDLATDPTEEKGEKFFDFPQHQHHHERDSSYSDSGIFVELNTSHASCSSMEGEAHSCRREGEAHSCSRTPLNENSIAAVSELRSHLRAGISQPGVKDPGVVSDSCSATSYNSSCSSHPPSSTPLGETLHKCYGSSSSSSSSSSSGGGSLVNEEVLLTPVKQSIGSSLDQDVWCSSGNNSESDISCRDGHHTSSSPAATQRITIADNSTIALIDDSGIAPTDKSKCQFKDKSPVTDTYQPASPFSPHVATEEIQGSEKSQKTSTKVKEDNLVPDRSGETFDKVTSRSGENLSSVSRTHTDHQASKDLSASSEKSHEDEDYKRLHECRSQLMQKIDREKKLKEGALNLHKAASNRRLKQTVETEIGYIDVHLKLLNEELAQIDMLAEQETSLENLDIFPSFPMIQVGLKETRDIDFQFSFKAFIEDHYGECGEDFEYEIEQFQHLRYLMRTVAANYDGLRRLYEYFNQLFFIEKRFFSTNRYTGIYFTWFDSITGQPASQRTMGFEKGSLLFNMAALHSQMAAQQERATIKDMIQVREGFETSAGIFKYLHDRFSSAPSTDMQKHTLKILHKLMLCQAQECILQKTYQEAMQQPDISHLHLAQEFTQVNNMYKYVRQLMHFDCVKKYFPPKWILLVEVKSLYYKATANYLAGLAILHATDHTLRAGLHGAFQKPNRPDRTKANENGLRSNENGMKPKESRLSSEKSDSNASCDSRKTDSGILTDLFEPLRQKVSSDLVLSEEGIIEAIEVNVGPQAKLEEEYSHKLLAKACMSRALFAYEDALRTHAEHQKLNRTPYYHDIHRLLKTYHDRCLQEYDELEEEDDFTQLSRVPNIKAKTEDLATEIAPDFSTYKVTDLFRKLGPLSIFCASHYWTSPRSAHMTRRAGQGFGFSIRGNAPVIVAEVETGSSAKRAGLEEGDFIVKVGQNDVRWCTHDEVVAAIKSEGSPLTLHVVTPLDRNYLNPVSPTSPMFPALSNGGGGGPFEKMSMDSRCNTLDRARNGQMSSKSSRSAKSLTWTIGRLAGVKTLGGGSGGSKLFRKSDSRKARA